MKLYLKEEKKSARIAIMNFTIYTLLLLNCVAFAVFGMDKYLAITNRHRISEKNLLFFALLGGSIGAIVAQQLFRHKTKKFKYILWLILCAHVGIGWFVSYSFSFFI
ncbi:MAG: DUF1294 domain-containing protein [Sulfuricurvum sp.]